MLTSIRMSILLVFCEHTHTAKSPAASWEQGWSWEVLGPSWEGLGRSCGHLGGHLGMSWASLGPCWDLLGRVGIPLGCIWRGILGLPGSDFRKQNSNTDVDVDFRRFLRAHTHTHAAKSLAADRGVTRRTARTPS